MEIHDDSNKTIYDEIEKDDSEFKLLNDVTNEPKSFVCHIATRNIRISVVLIKRAWKRRGKITDYVLKKKFKSKTNDKQRTKSEESTVQNTKVSVKEVKIIDPTEFTGDREWCWKEFERHIGVPKRWDADPSTVIAYIRGKKCQQFVPEAKSLKKPDGTGSVFLASDKPIRNCLCPDHECLCFGDTMINKRVKIPNNSQSKWNPKAFLKKADVNTFVKKFSEVSSGATQKEEKMYINRDICIRRCKQCQVSEAPQNIRYLPAFVPGGPTAEEKAEVGPWEPTNGFVCYYWLWLTGVACSEWWASILGISAQKTKTLALSGIVVSWARTNSSLPLLDYADVCYSDASEELLDNLERLQHLYFVLFTDPDEDFRICNVVFCTVSTQTDNGPDGELLTDQSIKISHVLFANNEKTYLPDIRGNKLQITHYTRVCPKGPDMQVCAKNMEKLLDLKEVKARLSKFISSIYEIKDPGIPVRTGSTQVPWRKRICDSLKTRPPDRCGDKNYDDLPKVPWNWRKIHEATCKEMKKDEFEEDENDDVCPCCELFIGSDIDKETLLEDMNNILSLPGDVIITKDQLIKDENISDVTTIIEEVFANTFDDIDENIKKEVQFIEAGNEDNEDSDYQKIDRIKQEEDYTEFTNEGNKKKSIKIYEDMEKCVLTNENGNQESVDKKTPHTKEIITENDNSKLDGLIYAEKALDEIATDEIGNNKKIDKCKKIWSKKLCPLSCSKTSKQKLTLSIESNKNRKNVNATDVEINNSKLYIENDNNGIEINSVLQKSDDQLKQEVCKELSSSTKINKISCKKIKILKDQKVASNIRNTSDKIVLQLNTSNKKASSAFSSLFKWLYEHSVQMSQFNKTSSVKLVPKDKFPIDETKLNEKDSKNSEKEVFSIRYTSSSISVKKSTSSGVENN